jgi:redox-sensitive bicupin YhaK (pirin superfamily)
VIGLLSTESANPDSLMLEKPMLTIRHAHDRGHANHGWLDSHHSFSFADYHDDAHMHFGPLRVINEDQIHPETGFGTHAHRDMEIISYVLDGELAHKDSMNNSVVIRPGEVQRMSAGTGVMHSEHNHADKTTHFLQIWIIPDTMNLQPGYEQKFFPDQEKRGKLRLVGSRSGELGSVIVHQDIRMYAGLFDGTESASLDVAPGRLVYVQVVRGSLSVNDQMLDVGDAAKLVDEIRITLSRGSEAEVLVFDLPATW